MFFIFILFLNFFGFWNEAKWFLRYRVNGDTRHKLECEIEEKVEQDEKEKGEKASLNHFFYFSKILVLGPFLKNW